MILVDASVWIDFLRGNDTQEADWLDHHLGSVPLGLIDLTLCEVLQGCPEPQVARVTERLAAFPLFATGGRELAIAAAKNYRRLRYEGHTVRKTIDCWIATFCLQESHQLLHSDRDFDPFERFLGLEVVHP